MLDLPVAARLAHFVTRLGLDATPIRTATDEQLGTYLRWGTRADAIARRQRMHQLLPTLRRLQELLGAEATRRTDQWRQERDAGTRTASDVTTRVLLLFAPT